jgi:hypothetical protein
MVVGLWDRFSDWICTAGVPLVYAYQLVCTDPFLSTEVSNASGLEYVANQVLTPVHYLFAGRVASPIDVRSDDGKVLLQYKFSQKFQYHDSLFWLKTAGAIGALPMSLTAGVAMKAISFLSPETRSHYRAIRASEKSLYVNSQIEHYKQLGLPIGNLSEAAFIEPPKHVRRPGDENHLQAEKIALKEILQIFEKNNIMSWVDCGTCIGAYRYGGVIPWDGDIDLAIIEDDHANAKRALNALDAEKYIVQDWSARSRPDTYLRVYIKETGGEIDLYHFRIDPATRTVSCVLSLEENMFMVESWKIRERRFSNSLSYDLVFPLKKANFDGIVVNVPNQIEPYLKSKYGENIIPAKI